MNNMVSPDFPEIFKRESFQGFAENVNDWKTLKRAFTLWQGRALTINQEDNLRFFAPAMGIYNFQEEMKIKTGFKYTRDRRGRYQLRDKRGRFVRVERRESHHKEKS